MKLSVSFHDSGKINKDVLISLFENYGSVNNVKVFRTLNSVSKSALAIVEMHSEIASEAALKSLNGLLVDDVRLKVEVSSDWVRGKSNAVSAKNQAEIRRDFDDDDEEDDDAYNKDDSYDEKDYEKDEDYDDEDYDNRRQKSLEIVDETDEPDVEYSW